MRLAEMLLTGRVETEAFRRAVDGATDSDVAAVLAMVDHEDPQVRWATAANLPLMGHGDPPSAAMVMAGVKLSADPDPKVRDWACMALGSQWREVDTPELRNALAARLHDEHDDTRREALVGLAYRRDARATDEVRRALSRETGAVSSLELEAAGALSDPTLHALVLDHVDGWDDAGAAAIADAARRLTDPDGVGTDVVDAVAELYRRRAKGKPEGDALTGWQTMSRLLEIAPHRVAEFHDTVAALLSGDEVATQQLREQSLLTQLAAGVR